MGPFFSIILPTFNQAHFLKICLKSIINQSFKNWELLIIDNNSTDDTQKIIKKYRDRRIKTFKINNYGILAKSRNIGIKKSKAEWICFIDSDDQWYPEKLKEVKKRIDRNEGDLFYHDLVFENKRFLFSKKIHDKSKTITKPILEYFAKNGNGIGQSSAVVRKKLFKKINYISERIDKFAWEDFDTWIRISKKTEKFVRIPKILGSITISSENISSLDRQIINCKNIKKYYGKIFNKILFKNNIKSIWWLEYPSILKDYKNRKINDCVKKIKKTYKPPIKFFLIFQYMKIILFINGIFKIIKKIN